jgi:hypothetical protein
MDVGAHGGQVVCDLALAERVLRCWKEAAPGQAAAGAGPEERLLAAAVGSPSSGPTLPAQHRDGGFCCPGGSASSSKQQAEASVGGTELAAVAVALPAGGAGHWVGLG